MNYKNRFEGQLALVTGGASGIGLAICQRILEEGGRVVMVDIDQAQLEKAKGSMSDYSEGVDTMSCDISDPMAVIQLFKDVSDRHGSLDIVVNSAGVVGPSGTKILDYDAASFTEVVNVNLTGSFLITKHAVAAMLPNQYGRILMLASIAGKDGNPGMAGYTASKAGVIGLVKGVAKEYADSGVTINALAPALIATPLNLKTAAVQLDYMKKKIPMARLGTVEEVAALACWIVSRESSFNTGFVFDMSGGRATY